MKSANEMELLAWSKKVFGDKVAAISAMQEAGCVVCHMLSTAKLDIPVLCLRGEHSDLLLRETCERMRNTGPCAAIVEVPECGHAPALNTPEQFRIVERFLTP